MVGCIRFSIIATDYDGVVSPDTLKRFLDSLKNQTFKDFEVYVMHDGPRSNPVPEEYLALENFHFVDSLFRGNAWGHNLRTLGMKMSKGDYIINTNTDNVYYPNALDELSYEYVDVLIADVLMMGLNKGPMGVWYDNPRDYSKSCILTGIPPVFGNIDMMSLIASRKVWEYVNYWFDITEQSDALIYEMITRIFSYKKVNIIIGEHY